MASKPIVTSDGIKLQDDVTGKLDGSVATRGKIPSTISMARTLKLESLLDDAKAGKISPDEAQASINKLLALDAILGKSVSDAYEKYQASLPPTITVSGGRAKILSKDEYFKNLSALGVDEKIADKAATVLSTNPPFLIAVSGKLASGKDTLAPAAFGKLGAEDPVHLYFAAALKDEVDQLLVMIRSDDGWGLVTQKAMKALNITHAMAAHMVGLLYEPARSLEGRNITARDRTPWIRSALQYWGVEVRRTQDPDYWVKQAIQSAARSIAEGKNIMVTDVRFPGEVEACQGIGFTVVRLEISPETQASRIMHRDGLVTDPQALLHATEVALDDFSAFNIVINSDELTKEETAERFISQFN